LIVDECHRAGSRVNALALRGRHRAVLGLSATPEREYDAGFLDQLKPALGDIIFEYDYVHAYADGIIAPFVLINIRINFLADEQAEYDRFTRLIAREVKHAGKESDRLKTLLRRRATVASLATMRVPVAAKLVDCYKNDRIIIFHERIEKANKLTAILTARGHSVTVYHSGIAPIIRRDNLRLFRRGMYDCLVTCRALDEGLNVPEARIAIIASSTASTRQRIQRLGRVLRPSPGKSEALVYTIYATDLEARRLFAEAGRLSSVAAIKWQEVSLRPNG
jgi:superfamily II DNA or RNA helicase